MPRFKQIPQIQALMDKKECIRNIGIIAHIDHGKTTLADCLLAGAGLLSPRMAGTARVLDYLEEEQKRKITIKTANIALLYNNQAESYLINLVDTPGHVDFTGKTTRALRVIDGAVVVVDAVEGIMAQTEILTRQALEERVCPVLFINKIDRLITELQLDEEAIQKKLKHIITSFNDLIEIYAEPTYKDPWKINANAGNVAFGAALYGWGFTIEMAKQRALKFSDIIAACKSGASIKLAEALPVYEAVFEMVTRRVSNPRKAQGYRIQKIWGGNLNSPIGKNLRECHDEPPIVMAVTNVYSDGKNGTLATGRVFSGKIRKGSRLHLVGTMGETEVQTVYVDMGALREEVGEALAGNLVTLSLSGKVEAGETLWDSTCQDGMVPFECINYISEPVVTLVVEPKNPQDIETFQGGLERLVSEDPNLKFLVDKETGEYLLSGMGELHFEVAINELRKVLGIDVVVSPPRVVYWEYAQKSGVVALALSADKQSNVRVQVEPNLKQDIDSEEKEQILANDDYNNSLIDVEGKAQQLSKEMLDAIKAGFRFACAAGPLCGEPIHQLRVGLIDCEIAPNTTVSEIEHTVSKAVFGSFLTANPSLQEPIYKIILSVAADLAGDISRILNSRRGKVTQFEQKGPQTQITGYIPVAETFGLSKELRSTTSGKAVWQSIFDHWEKLPPKLAQEIINEIRKRKGLPKDVAKPERFMEV
ncbi:MAG: GTP-binding protein [Nitrososphaerota archaeon]|jgi:elongation factor 2|uniref:GTP-binding protein n=1 Tax=Candidatus Bathycorpusculum sp. TaxID=2994959 RepID=UPI002820D8CD|nr:GTP-binding protein [Candidatus Termitimicrobium sp.]MCL2431471.1 GTP-binding protein [Candidatus Termitimicrobium sp.]MDR0492097.1 GTP-binding protein [Nitrososphaerota archaeon]